MLGSSVVAAKLVVSGEVLIFIELFKQYSNYIPTITWLIFSITYLEKIRN
jgi:hypothetical protein